MNPWLSNLMKHPWAMEDRAFDALQAALAVQSGAGMPEPFARYGASMMQPGERPKPYCLDAQGARVEFAAAGAGKSGKLIAVIPIWGVIAEGWWGTAPSDLSRQLREAVANADVKAIVLDIDSPGGSVYGVDELAAEIFAARAQKKIVAQVNPLCCSAAYYLASQATEIAMMPSGECGSIGVRTMWVGMEGALEQAGYEVKHIFAGRYKVEGNPYEPLAKDAQEFLQKRVDEYYGAFVKAVARGRGVPVANVRSDFGEGRTVGAVDAKKMGLVDRIATMDETLQRLGGDAAAAVPMARAGGAAIQAGSGDCECPCQPCKDGDCSNCDCEDCSCAGCTCPDNGGEDEDGDYDESASRAAGSASVVNTAEAGKKEGVMPEVNTAAAAAGVDTAQVLQAERERCGEIQSLASQHNVSAEQVAKWVSEGTSVELVRGQILTSYMATAKPVIASPGIQAVRDVDDKTKGDMKMAQMARCLAFARGNRQLAAERARVLGYGAVAQYLASGPQVAGTAAGGGTFVPENWVADLIPNLYATTAVRSLNPRSYPLVNGNLTLPKMTSQGQSGYGEEVSNIPESNAGTGEVKFVSKKLRALMPISNDLIRFAGLSADAAFRDDMNQVISITEDTAFIRGKGSQSSPRGLYYMTTPANIVPSGLTAAQIAANAATMNAATYQAVLKDLSNALLRLVKAKIKMIRPGWIFSKRTENFLMYQVYDAVGNLPFKEEMLTGKLLGKPYRATVTIPDNLSVVGAGIDSEIYLADFFEIAIADAPTISVEISTEASYVDGSGQTRSAFQQDLTLVRYILEHDIQPLHDEAITVISGVEYGA